MSKHDFQDFSIFRRFFYIPPWWRHTPQCALFFLRHGFGVRSNTSHDDKNNIFQSVKNCLTTKITMYYTNIDKYKDFLRFSYNISNFCNRKITNKFKHFHFQKDLLLDIYCFNIACFFFKNVEIFMIGRFLYFVVSERFLSLSYNIVYFWNKIIACRFNYSQHNFMSVSFDTNVEFHNIISNAF